MSDKPPTSGDETNDSGMGTPPSTVNPETVQTLWSPDGMGSLPPRDTVAPDGTVSDLQIGDLSDTPIPGLVDSNDPGEWTTLAEQGPFTGVDSSYGGDAQAPGLSLVERANSGDGDDAESPTSELGGATAVQEDSTEGTGTDDLSDTPIPGLVDPDDPNWQTVENGEGPADPEGSYPGLDLVDQVGGPDDDDDDEPPQLGDAALADSLPDNADGEAAAATEAADEAEGLSASEAIQDTAMGLTTGQAATEAADEAQGMSASEAIQDTAMGLTTGQAATEAADEAQGMSASEAIQDTAMGLTTGQAATEAADEAQGMSASEAIQDTAMGLTTGQAATEAADEAQGMSASEAIQDTAMGLTTGQAATEAADEAQGMSASEAIEDAVGQAPDHETPSDDGAYPTMSDDGNVPDSEDYSVDFGSGDGEGDGDYESAGADYTGDDNTADDTTGGDSVTADDSAGDYAYPVMSDDGNVADYGNYSVDFGSGGEDYSSGEEAAPVEESAPVETSAPEPVESSSE